MADDNRGMDATLHDQKQKAKKRARGPRDYATIDLFEGAPRGAPPKPKQMSKRAAAVLEWLLSLNTPTTLTKSTENLPRDDQGNPITGIERIGADLVKAGYLRAWFPPNVRPLAGRTNVRFVATEKARLWLRERRDSPPPAPKPPAPDTKTAVPPELMPTTEERIRWAYGRLRFLAKRNEEVSASTFFHDMRRAPESQEELDAVEAALSKMAADGLLRVTPSRSEQGEHMKKFNRVRWYRIYTSLIVEGKPR